MVVLRCSCKLGIQHTRSGLTESEIENEPMSCELWFRSLLPKEAFGINNFSRSMQGPRVLFVRPSGLSGAGGGGIHDGAADLIVGGK